MFLEKRTTETKLPLHGINRTRIADWLSLKINSSGKQKTSSENLVFPSVGPLQFIGKCLLISKAEKLGQHLLVMP